MQLFSEFSQAIVSVFLQSDKGRLINKGKTRVEIVTISEVQLASELGYDILIEERI